MRTILILLFGVHLGYTATHSLRYVYTAVSGDIDFPEFTAVGLVDEEQFMCFDSKIMKAVPKTDWIRQNEEADYWDRETQALIGIHQAFKSNIQTAQNRFNQSQGVQTVQEMYGCEWDDQTGATNGFQQDGYDGEDFLSLDFKEMRFISPVQQGFSTIHKWNNNRDIIENYRNYFSTVCIDWLKKYIQYGKSSLEKTVSPQVSLLQKSSTSPVLCHATGFYPSAIKISWMKNGEDHDEDVDLGELLPNGDGTFQRRSTLNVKPEEWKNNKFSCVVEHQGQTKTETEIRTNEAFLLNVIAGVIAIQLLIVAIAGIWVYQKKKGFKPVSQECNFLTISAPVTDSNYEKNKSQTTFDSNTEKNKSQTSDVNSVPDPGYSSGSDKNSDCGSHKSSNSTSDIMSVSSDNSSDSTTALLRSKQKMTENQT